MHVFNLSQASVGVGVGIGVGRRYLTFWTNPFLALKRSHKSETKLFRDRRKNFLNAETLKLWITAGTGLLLHLFFNGTRN